MATEPPPPPPECLRYHFVLAPDIREEEERGREEDKLFSTQQITCQLGGVQTRGNLRGIGHLLPAVEE